MSTRLRKKPVEIVGLKWTGDNVKECANFLGNSFMAHNDTDSKILILTLEGHMSANKGDWLLRDVNGEHYPCKPDILDKTYDILEE